MNKLLLRKSLILILAALVVIGGLPGLFVLGDGKTLAGEEDVILTEFGFLLPAVTGTITQPVEGGNGAVAVTVPYGTNVSGLVAVFTIGENRGVNANDESQISGTTANDFSSPVTYSLYINSEYTRDYVVTVTVAPAPSAQLNTFKFTSPDVTDDAIGVIDQEAKTVAVTVPYGTTVTALSATFGISGDHVEVGEMTQESAETPNDFTDPVDYRVYASDASYVTYTVTVTVAPPKILNTFSFTSPAAIGVIDQGAKTVAVTVPYGTTLTALAATFDISGDHVEIGEVTQESAVTTNDFTDPVGYRVYASDASYVTYTVMVTVAAPKILNTFSFTSPAAIGVIDQGAKTVAVTVPYGTTVTALVATFGISGNHVEVGEVTQESAETTNDFTDPVGYRVYASDASYVTYTVTVTVAPPKILNTFSFTSPAADGFIDQGAKTVAVTVPYGTTLTALAATFDISGDYVEIGEVTQESAVTTNDFTDPVGYRVYASDASYVTYTVTVTVAAPKILNTFSFTSPAAIGVIDQGAKTVAVTVPYGTTVTALVATFGISGNHVEVGEVTQESGVTTNNFTSPVVYKVYPSDESSHVEYTVTVTIASRTPDESPTSSAPTSTPTPTPTPSKQIIVVDVKNSGAANGGVVSKAEIERTTQPDGTKKDDVNFNLDQASKTVESIIAAGSKSASIVIPDTNDEVSEVNVTIPKESSKLVVDSKIDFGISTDNVKVLIPNSSLVDFNDDLFFKFTPIKKEAEKQEVKKRASNEAIVRIVAGDNEVAIVGRPMTIETNMQSREVTLIMPLGDVNLSEDELKDLGVFIEHSDGTKELLRGILVPFNDEGDLGLQFIVGKFSTFTLVHIEGLAVQEHIAYMKGYKDGTFRAEKSITRAELAAILSRVIDQRNTTEDRAYKDVSLTLWAKAAISKVTTMGLMKGYSDGTFGAEQSVSRAEMAVLIDLIMGNPTTSGAGFSDIAGHWAEASILSSQAAGMINGYADGTFRPNESLTRAETVTIMNKVLGRRPLIDVGQLPWSDVARSHWAIIDIAEASVDHSYEAITDGEQWVSTH